MLNRARRLRTTPLLRSMVRETRMSSDSLILPLFLKEGQNLKEEIPSLEGQYHYSPDRIGEQIEKSLKHGVNKFLLFGLPAEKDETGSEAYAENGIVQQGLRKLRDNFGDSIYLITDICMC